MTRLERAKRQRFRAARRIRRWHGRIVSALIKRDAIALYAKRWGYTKARAEQAWRFAPRNVRRRFVDEARAA